MKHKILYVLGGPLDNGGITSFSQNYTFMLKSHYDIHIFSLGDDDPIKKTEFECNGITLHNTCYRSVSIFKYISDLVKLLNETHFEIIHIHEDIMSFFPSIFCKLFSRKSHLVLHSHNTSITSNNNIKNLIYPLFKKLNCLLGDSFLACSSDAGNWLFEGLNYKIIYNAIPVHDFYFSNFQRDKLRSFYNFNNKFVVGFVGRIDFQKNPEFLYELSKDLKIYKDIIFVVVGDGDLCSYLNIDFLPKNILHIGPSNEVNNLLNMFDLFIMPSRFEGLGIAAIEAQYNSLNVLVSNNFPCEVSISKKLHYLPLNLYDWKSYILKMKCTDSNREDFHINNYEYDIKKSYKLLLNFYKEAIYQ
jgi:glycosyltransferase involved in cell wall biosynthesis